MPAPRPSLPGDDLGRAIRASEEAVEATALDDPGRVRSMDELAVNLRTRFDLDGDLVSLERAISVGEDAVVAIPPNHPRISLLLYKQSSRYKPGFMQLGTLTDFENSIQLAEKAVASTPPDGLDYAGVLIHLASVLLGRRGDQKQCHQRPLNISQKAWHSQMSSPQQRLVAAQLAASILANDLRWKETSDLLSRAVGMLPTISPQFLGRDDQQHLLAGYQFSASAIAYVLQAGSPAAHCLTLLGLGRRISTGFAINCRSDLLELRLKHPKIFDELTTLNHEIDSPLRPMDVDTGHPPDMNWQNPEDMNRYRRGDEDRRRRRLQAIQEVDERLASVRQLPGFETFRHLT